MENGKLFRTTLNEKKVQGARIHFCFETECFAAEGSCKFKQKLCNHCPVVLFKARSVLILGQVLIKPIELTQDYLNNRVHMLYARDVSC